MATAARSIGTAPPVCPDDELPSGPKMVRGWIVVSTRYGLKLEVCEQTTPIRGWVIVACRSAGRLTQLRGVYTSQSHAEAAALSLAGRWVRKFGMPAPDTVPAAIATFWELEWNDADASSPPAMMSQGLPATDALSATVFKRAI